MVFKHSEVALLSLASQGPSENLQSATTYNDESEEWSKQKLTSSDFTSIYYVLLTVHIPILIISMLHGMC